MNDKQNKIAGKIITDCIKHGVAVHLYPIPYINDKSGEKYIGSFDEDKKKIVIACDRKCWLSPLAHEYSHFLQYLGKLEMKHDRDTVNKAYETLSKYIDEKKRIGKKRLSDAVDAIQDCELVAEKNCLKILESSGHVEFSKSGFIEMANIYVLSFHVVAGERRWVDVTAACGDKKIRQSVPSNFLDDYSKIDDRLYGLLRGY